MSRGSLLCLFCSSFAYVVMFCKAKSVLCVFVVSLPSMTMADTPGQYDPVAPHEALVVLYQEMLAASHQRIRMVIKWPANLVYFFHRQLETKVVR